MSAAKRKSDKSAAQPPTSKRSKAPVAASSTPAALTEAEAEDDASASPFLAPAVLWRSRSLPEWRRHADAYADGRALAASFALKKSRPAAVDSVAEYRRLDRTASGALNGAASVTRAQLLDIINWKHTRGKLRPNYGKVAQNAPAAVEAATRVAFAYLVANPATSAPTSKSKGKVSAKASGADEGSDNELDEDETETRHVAHALDLLSKPLHGVGPATASAVLAAAHPDRCAFASDDLLALALRGRKPAYAAAEVTIASAALRAKAARMQHAIAIGEMERALFAAAMLHRPSA
jgi:hypothetical protein